MQSLSETDASSRAFVDQHHTDYRPDIDGLRAVAVGAVVAFHAFPGRLPGGFLGVDIFFVISGYLITANLLGTLAAGRFTFGGFYARRIRRIFPALAVTLFAAAAIGWIVQTPAEYAALGRQLLASAAFASNFLLWSQAGYFDATAAAKPLLHIWSLGIEEQFYIFWPLLLWALWRRRLSMVGSLVLLSALSFALNLILTARYPVAAFYMPLARAWELGAGGVLAARHAHRTSAAASAGYGRVAMSVLGLVLIGVALVAINSTQPFPGWRAAVPVAGTVLIIAGGMAAAPNRLLGHRVLVAIGLISYPIYLWHWLLLSFAFIATTGVPPVSARLGLVALSVILAALTYLLVERPIRTRPISATRSAALATSLALAAILGTAILRSGGVPWRFPEEVRALLRVYDFRADARIGECWVDGNDPPNAHAPACYANPAGRPSVFIWGDSHAGRFYPGVQQVYGDTLSIADLVRNSCPPRLFPVGESCTLGNEYVLSLVKQYHPDLVVLFAVWPVYPPSVPEGVPSLAEKTIAAGAHHVIVLGPAPLWKGGLPTLVFRAWEAKGRGAILPRQTLGLNPLAFDVDRLMRQWHWTAGVEYVSLTDMLCNEQGCLTLVPGSNDSLITWDYGHMTTAGAAYVARRLALQDRVRTVRDAVIRAADVIFTGCLGGPG